MPCGSYMTYLLPTYIIQCRAYCKCIGKDSLECRRCIERCLRAMGIDY